MGDFKEGKESLPSVVQTPTIHGLESELAQIIESHLNSRRKAYPQGVPRDSAEAVQWFTKLFAGQKHNEAVRQLSTRNGKKYWIWPYADRLKYLTKKFFMAEQELRELIIAARQDRIEWRGDDFDFFVRVIDETEKMRGMGIDAYRKHAISEMRRAFAGVVA